MKRWWLARTMNATGVRAIGAGRRWAPGKDRFIVRSIDSRSIRHSAWRLRLLPCARSRFLHCPYRFTGSIPDITAGAARCILEDPDRALRLICFRGRQVRSGGRIEVSFLPIAWFMDRGSWKKDGAQGRECGKCASGCGLGGGSNSCSARAPLV